MILGGTGWKIFAPWYIISIFEKSHSWREIRVIEFKVHGKRTKMERKNLKKILSYPSEKKWHLQATELNFV